jgi:hypothetical protein
MHPWSKMHRKRKYSECFVHSLVGKMTGSGFETWLSILVGVFLLLVTVSYPGVELAQPSFIQWVKAIAVQAWTGP